MPERPRGNRLVVMLQPERRPELERLAAELASVLPDGRVVRTSRRGRILLTVEGDPAAFAEQLNGRPEVLWAEADTVDREAADGG